MMTHVMKIVICIRLQLLNHKEFEGFVEKWEAHTEVREISQARKLKEIS